MSWKAFLERPKKRQKQFYSGKQREHTLKTQLIIGQKSGLIICLVNGKGKTHDFKLFKNSRVKFGTLIKVIADKGWGAEVASALSSNS